MLSERGCVRIVGMLKPNASLTDRPLGIEGAQRHDATDILRKAQINKAQCHTHNDPYLAGLKAYVNGNKVSMQLLPPTHWQNILHNYGCQRFRSARWHYWSISWRFEGIPADDNPKAPLHVLLFNINSQADTRAIEAPYYWSS